MNEELNDQQLKDVTGAQNLDPYADPVGDDLDNGICPKCGASAFRMSSYGECVKGHTFKLRDGKWYEEN